MHGRAVQIQTGRDLFLTNDEEIVERITSFPCAP